MTTFDVVGDALALSVTTPQHLSKIGLLPAKYATANSGSFKTTNNLIWFNDFFF